MKSEEEYHLYESLKANDPTMKSYHKMMKNYYSRQIAEAKIVWKKFGRTVSREKLLKDENLI